MRPFSELLLVILPCFVPNILAAQESILSQEFLSFEKQFNRIYSSKEERLARHGIFNANLVLIKQHNNKPGVSYKMGVNQFSDMTGKR